MKKYIKPLLFTSLALVGNVHAVSIVMDRQGASGMVVNDSANTRVPTGSLVRLGTVNTGNAITAANFVEFYSTTTDPLFIVNGPTNTLASIGGSIRAAVNITGTAASIANKQVLMWIYDGTSASSSADQGLFTSVGWVIPANFATDDLATYNMPIGSGDGLPAPVITTLAITDIGAASIATGNVQNGSGTVNPFGTIYTLGQAIPEPSAVLLGAFGVLGLLRRRRI